MTRTHHHANRWRMRRETCRFAICLGISILAIRGPQILQADENEPFFAAEQAAILAAVAQISPSLARIQTLGGLESSQGILASNSPTTGVILSQDGYLLSSAFHFIQEPTSILVTLADGSQHPAKLVARDHARQLVLLKIDADRELPTPEMADRDAMQVGQRTIALGQTFGGELPSISLGILSATDRIWGRALQTDAKVSPNNYGGPLIDLKGRMLGLLVPLSPQSNSDVAGVEWYDSGIGFAAYLDDLESRWETLKSGTDLRPGLMGIALKGKNIFTMPAIVAAVQVGSPAAESGVQVDDEIVAVDDRQVSLQTHLKHALGVRYAGDSVQLTLRRGTQNVQVTLQLAETIEPYATPLLGVLPERESPAETDDNPPPVGLGVRYVYQDSPAAKAGIDSSCRLLGIDHQPLNSVSDWRAALAKYQAGDTLAVWWRDGSGTQQQRDVVLAELPTIVPAQLAPAATSTDPAATSTDPAGDAPNDPQPEVALAEWLEVKVPELPNKCFALIPTNLRSPQAAGDARKDKLTLPHGVLLLLAPPGAFDKDSQRKAWQAACHARQLILLAPQARDPARWQRDELELVRKTLDSLGRQFPLDAHRITVVGQQSGGAMALHFTLANRDLVRGLALVDAQLPRRMSPPENQPLERLDVFLVNSASGANSKSAKRLVELLQKQKFPVIQRQLKGSSELADSQRAELVRWVDTLDRI